MNKIDAWAVSTTDMREKQRRDVGSAGEPLSNKIGPFASSRESRPSIGTQFESMFLRQAFENMLPKDSESVYGGGTAGGFWRSMLAENLANALADRNILGLAATVEPTLKSNLKDDAE